jgi:hypothetical protein
MGNLTGLPFIFNLNLTKNFSAQPFETSLTALNSSSFYSCSNAALSFGLCSGKHQVPEQPYGAAPLPDNQPKT